jgi:hypothetical protein
MSMKYLKWLYLVQRRSIWCPTWLGAFCMIALLAGPMVWWYLGGESFLSATRRLPAEVLVVEGWIGEEGVRAAAAEFRQHDYRYVVATGGVTSERWEPDRWSYASLAERELIRSGIPRDQVIDASAGDVKNRRTYQAAVAVWRALQARGIQPKDVNVFTLGPHAARSRLVFAKVFGPGTRIGVVDWIPSDQVPGPWWRSSERAKELILETAGYLFEFVFNSGRSQNMIKTPTGVSPQQAGRGAGDRPESDRAELVSSGVPGSGLQRGVAEHSGQQP